MRKERLFLTYQRVDQVRSWTHHRLLFHSDTCGVFVGPEKKMSLEGMRRLKFGASFLLFRALILDQYFLISVPGEK